jgi:Ca2+-binding EF-hand superfamily protein
VNGLSRSDVLEIKDAFDLIDTGSTGKIDPTCKTNIN